MKNLLFIITLFTFGSFVNAQIPVSHNINNNTYNNPSCEGYEFFASFDNTDDCNPSAGMPCFDVPLGNTNHYSSNQSCDTPFTNINDVKAMTLKVINSNYEFVISFCDQSGNILLSGSDVIGLPSCNLPNPFNVLVAWNINLATNVIDITIY